MGKGSFGCVKWLLTVFNFIFLMCGLAICALGVWMLVSPSTMNELIGKNLAPIISYIFLGIGGTIILISFCGCAGAGLENRCLLCLFFTVLCGIFVACLVASILVAIFRNDLASLTGDRLSNNLVQYYGSNQAWTEFWDRIQTKFACCGVNDDRPSIVYQKTQWYIDNKPLQLPQSCCAMKSVDILINVNQCQKGIKTSINQKGCMTAIASMVMAWWILAVVVVASVAVVLIVGMVLALVHLRNIINSRYIEYSHPI